MATIIMSFLEIGAGAEPTVPNNIEIKKKAD